MSDPLNDAIFEALLAGGKDRKAMEAVDEFTRELMRGARPKKEKPMDKCSTCRFWAFAGTTDHNGRPRGECRRYSPKWAADDFGGGSRLFPVTSSEDGCGEHAAAEAEEPRPGG